MPLLKQNSDDLIILTWAEAPKDLDLHLGLLYNDQSKNCEVFYGNPKCEGAVIDTDSTNGQGPETIAIKEYQKDVTYMIYVYDYEHDEENPLYTSEGRVYLGPKDKDPITVIIPNDESSQRRFWIIGCFRGDDKLENIQIVNELVDQLPINHIEYCTI